MLLTHRQARWQADVGGLVVGAHQLLPHEEYGCHICADTAPLRASPASVHVIIHDLVCQGRLSIIEASNQAGKGRLKPGHMRGAACHLKSISKHTAIKQSREGLNKGLTEGVGNDLVDEHDDYGCLHPAGPG
jgi:hypothetical protein